MTSPEHAPIRRQTLGDLLRRTAKRFPNKDAIIFNDDVWSYAEFDCRCNQLAHGLIAQGIGKGDAVAVLSYNSNEFTALRFAIARIGAVLVPINFMLNAKEAAYNIGHSGAIMLCVGSDFVKTAKLILKHDVKVEKTVLLPGIAESDLPEQWLDYETLISNNEHEPNADVQGSDLAQIIYTSDTESQPKGAMLTHEAIIWQYVSCLVDGEITTRDKILHALPLYHCAQLDVFLGPAIYVGATNVILSTPTPDTILPLIEQHEITSFFSPPTVWIALMRSPLFDKSDLTSLCKGYYGAAIMPVEILKELAQRLPTMRLWNFYGQTEIAPLAASLAPNLQQIKAGAAGRAVLNVETRVVNDKMQDVAIGEVGEIVHRSPQLLSGYFNDQERTNAAFKGGWFHSGDLAILDSEGYITIVDRKKDMVKTGGENVASREVEECIYQLEQVAEVAVIGLPHPTWVEAVFAVVVLKTGASLSETTLLAHCKNILAHFKAPKGVVFAESLPKNPSGKILKRNLRTEYKNIMM
ncbi:MAG: acyl-CoA synthetase [Cohaesibacteraceae bacterium]|nr:acyl-CoA synthetase [Gammaproteobacteria bacterium]MBL4876410.1 acyl-CoA synthetase [Cohaesibacteraceae bacterium]